MIPAVYSVFADPRLLWLALLAPAAAAALAFWLWRRRLDADAAWASRGLWDRLLPTYSPRRIRTSVLCLALAALSIPLALARPRWGAGQEEVERRGVDVVFVLDSSRSMSVLDVPPSRLFVAKALIRRMARAMPENRIGLVQAEGTAEVLAPLTLDGAVIDLLLDTVEPGSLSTPGTVLAPGLQAALKLFGEGSEKHRVLILLSDGEDHGGGIEPQIARLREEGVIVHAFGIGTPSGGPVPIQGTGNRAFKRESDGSLVVSRLHEDTLEGMTRATNGLYLRVVSAAADPTPVLQKIDGMEKRTIEGQLSNHLAERFQWPLALAAGALLLHLARGPFTPRAREERPAQPAAGEGGRRAA